MKKNVKKIIFSSILALPLFLSPIVSASSSVDVASESDKNNNYSEYAYPSPVPVIVDGTGGPSYVGYYKRVHYTQSTPNFTAKKYYSEFNSEHEQWIKGYLHFEKSYWDSDKKSYVGVYSGKISNKG